MSVVASLASAVRALRREPVLFVPFLALSLLQVPQLFVGAIDQGTANFLTLLFSLVTLVVVPFVHGGVFGMASEALDGGTSPSTFFAAGRRNYLSLLAVQLLFLVVGAVIGVVVGVALIVVVFARYPGGAGDTTALVVAVLAVVAVVLLVALAIGVFAQFYPHAIVLDDRGALGGIRRSAALVRSNLPGVLGYSLVVIALGGLTGLVPAVVSLATSSTGPLVTAGPAGGDPSIPAGGDPSMGLLTVGALVVVASTTLFSGFLVPFSVSYYRSMTTSA